MESLKDQWITTKYLWSGEEKYPLIDTSEVYLAFLDNNWNIRSWRMDSIPVKWYYIDWINITGDGYTTFSMVNIKTWGLQKYIFSKNKWEESTNKSNQFYKKQLK
jgi:hypothetical protein